jgi:hypothetical protein
MKIAVNSTKGSYYNPAQGLINNTNSQAGTSPNDGYTIEVITGEAVITLLVNDTSFQKSWDLLFESCPWATIFQSRQFITAWYRIYGLQHCPVLLKAVASGQLHGLLPMALLNAPGFVTGSGGKITGAGHYDAQYQSWLAAPSNGETFIKNALAELMKQFPGHPISFRFLPPAAPLDWVMHDKKWRQCSILQSYKRPLINFNDPGHAKLYKGSHFRNKFNRLKRLGEVHFDHITDFKSFESALNEMAILYDFRHSALFNKNHFRDDPLKKDFLLELFRLDLLHTTVLKVEGRTIAAVVAITGTDGWVHLSGINCHAPFKARAYSPGILQFSLLSKKLAEAGVQYFDLTPGYDPYKEELANAHDEVKELVISHSLKFHVKKKIRKWVHARLVAAGIRPMTVELNLKRYFYLARRRNILSVMKRLTGRLKKSSKQQLYFIRRDSLPTIKMLLHKDSLRDLLHFDAEKSAGITRWEFLADAMRRFEDGQHCFTWVENGRLLCCAWFSYPDAFSTTKNNDPVTENTIVLKSFFCHAAAKERVLAFLYGVLDITVDRERSSFYLLANDPLFCHILDVAGFPVV